MIKRKSLIAIIVLVSVLTVCCFQKNFISNASNIGDEVIDVEADSMIKALEPEEPESYIVVAKDETSYDKLKVEHVDTEYEEISNENCLGNENILVAELTSEEIQNLENNDDVKCIEENSIVTGSSLSKKKKGINKDNKTVSNWNVKMVNAEDGYKKDNKEGNDNKVKVALLDSGVDAFAEHINVVDRINMIPGQEEVLPLFEDTSGHGTSIAALLAASKIDDSGVVGINPNVEIYSAKILDYSNSAPVSRVIDAIYWAIDKNVNIISMSFGTIEYSAALEKAIKDAYEKGILIVAAAGNRGLEDSNIVEYPAAFEEVIAVGAIDSQGKYSEESSSGKEVELVAPGEAITCLTGFNYEMISSGTSLAVPHVVGIASLLWEKDMSKSNDFIRSLMNVSANSIDDNDEHGNGLVDYEYAESVYDEFENEYKKYIKETENNSNEIEEVSEDINKKNDIENELKNIIENNGNEIKKYDVEGSWTKNTHEELVKYGDDKADVGLTSKSLKLLKYGATVSDSNSDLKTASKNPMFHGYYQWRKDADSKYEKDCNYIAGYIYLTECAIKGKYNLSKDKYTYLTNIRYKDYVQVSEIDKKLEESEVGKKKMILLGYNATPEQYKLLLWGMAIHTITDAYAHSAYAYHEENGKWQLLTHSDLFKTSPSTDPDADDVKEFPNRYKCVKEVVCNVMDKFKDEKVGSYTDFYAKSYDGSFKLVLLSDFAEPFVKTMGDASSEIKTFIDDITYKFKTNN